MGKISIKAARINRNLTQDDLAEIMQVHRNTISAWEHNPNDMSIKDAEKLCKVLKLPLDAIFFEPNLQNVENVKN